MSNPLNLCTYIVRSQIAIHPSASPRIVCPRPLVAVVTETLSNSSNPLTGSLSKNPRRRHCVNIVAKWSNTHARRRGGPARKDSRPPTAFFPKMASAAIADGRRHRRHGRHSTSWRRGKTLTGRRRARKDRESTGATGPPTVFFPNTTTVTRASDLNLPVTRADICDLNTEDMMMMAGSL
jgi:hypothetical protein